MQLFNVEIFKPDLTYRSSNQIMDIQCDYDYLAINTGGISVPSIRAEEGDYIRIKGFGMEYVGMVESDGSKDKTKEIRYKPMLSILDVNAHFSEKTQEQTLEEWIGGIIRELYVDTEDEYQKMNGLSVVIRTETQGSYTTEENIANLYQMATDLFIRYGIVIRFEMDIQKKEILCIVEKNQKEERHIEADLPNILSSNFVIKQAEKVVNKLTVYNRLDETQKESYYLLESGEISKEKEAAGRIIPVVFDSEFIEYQEGGEQTFSDKAYEVATSRMALPEYNNLIELEVKNEDSLVKPVDMDVGQQMTIIHEGKAYRSILTGKKIGKSTVLVFGTVRLELTKKLKMRLKEL